MRELLNSAIMPAALLLVVAACKPAGAELQGSAHVIDGDTIAIGATHVRLVGIDAPETHQTCWDRRGAPLACGEAAAKALSGFIGSDPVSCQRKGEDTYDRVLGTCSVRGEDLQRWMVQRGHALAFTRYSHAYETDQVQARAAGRGVWAGDLVPPWDYRACVRQGGSPPSCSRMAGTSERPAAPPAPSPPQPSAESTPPSAECRIKGNLNQAGERIYHLPSSPDYDRIVMRLDRGKRWFCSEQEAAQAGWRPARR